jgi:lipopolysaccharide export system protein LptC
MAAEANLLKAGPRYRVRTPEERERAFRSGARHSRAVRLLRKILPLVAVLVLTAYFISTQLNVTVGDMTASIDGMEIADGNLRMLNPTLKGSDKRNGKYVVHAEYADQDIQNPKIIKLHAIQADLSSASGGWTRMKAARGIFNSLEERLVMQDRITIATSAGITGELEHATLDMESQTLRSHRPVFFELENGTVRANAFTFRSAEKTLVFRGKVKVHLVRETKEEKTGDDKPEPSQLPWRSKAPAPASPASVPTVSPQ